ncbi:MAG: hypothetical protein LH473_05975 [Chitinophagales bacterium]|nr:hypothetical protein [Chitinophagales bacterium]
MLSSLRILFLIVIVLALSSCKKDAGEGGTSSIKGKIYIKDFNSAGQLQAEYYATEERVYIIYGDADFYGNDTRTSFDGTYQFNYLRKGSYTIFAYQKCDTCASGVEPVKVLADINDNHSTIDLADLILNK